MPNVTITVPEELKTQMDKYSEVSWSEISRNAISQYIAQRENPTPRIDLDFRQSRMDYHDWETGYPTLIVDLRIQNRMSTKIIVDRILSTARTEDKTSHTVVFGQANDLHRKIIQPNSVGLATLRLTFPQEKLEECRDKFENTFDCKFICSVYVDDFNEPYRQEFTVQIPIDLWNKVINKAVNNGKIPSA